MTEALKAFYLPGAAALWAAVGFALASLAGYVQVLRGDESARPFARLAYRLYALSIVLAAIVLLVALARRDFRIEYVYEYSGVDLPFRFQLAAFWAGQKGSFLLWLLWGSLLGLPLLVTAGKHEASVVGIYLLTLLGVLFILVRENAFQMLDHTSPDGKGLNPLLQDNWMVIHPPVMFLGYALAAVPFAFAMSALWRRDTSDWAARAFPWALGGFLVLGCAILLGGYWAYKTLGWGGYWGWDPVENASLIPFLFGTALIHGLHMERTRGRYRRANFVLASLVFLSVLYGTFLTRSGVLADFSVHSFVDLGISGWLIGLMGAFLGLSVWLLSTRLRAIESPKNEDPLVSRGTALVLATITILGCAAVVTVGTSAPLLTRLLPNPGQVGPEFYNRVNFPLALLVALLLAVVPFLTWSGESDLRALGKKLARALVAGAVATAVAVYGGVRDPLHLAFFFLATTALATNLEKVIAKARAAGLPGAGGYLAHVGVGTILIGILASSAYDRSTKVTLPQGQAVRAGDLTLTFIRPLQRTETERERMEVEVVKDDGSRYLAYPKLFVNDRTQQTMANPHVRSYLLSDLYVSPIDYDPGDEPGGFTHAELTRGQVTSYGDVKVRFIDFNLNRDGNALAKMAKGETVVIGAMLEVERAGTTTRLEPVYKFSGDGRVEFPPLDLPGGGKVAVGAIRADNGGVDLLLSGIESAAKGRPAALSLDVTRKPLMWFVWGGLYIVLAGGTLALVSRARQLRTLATIAQRR